MKNILIVEDESIVAMEIESYIQNLGHNVVSICSSKEEAYNKVLTCEIDIILMDINLVDSNGIDAAKRIKEIKDIAIIYITAYMDEETIARAVETNPVAYLMKPFNRQELLAAIMLATSKLEPKVEKFVGGIVFDDEFSFCIKTNELIYLSRIINLTKKEKELLKLFIKYKNSFINIETIEMEIWPDKIPNDNTRRALISRLRAKINHKFITTVASQGYIFKY